MGGTRIPVRIKAITTKEISGSAIETIPVGTEFMITWINIDDYKAAQNNKYNNSYNSYSCCEGLGVSDIWNNEFKLIG
jgi:hypothetical protein